MPRALGAAVLFAILLFLGGCGAAAPLEYQLVHTYGVRDPQFVRTMGALLGPPMVNGNRVQTLINGNEIFPAMLKAIHGATRTITFETFVYLSGQIGNEFAQALSERARAGVKVHVIIDWLGAAGIDPNYISMMTEAGADVIQYHPVTPFTWDKVNFRTHRKILVVDGRIGFTGGVGIADEWLGDAQDAEHWRDNHYRVEGPVVAFLQAAFVDNWLEAKRQSLDSIDYFPPLEPVGPLYAQVFTSSPDGGSASMQLMYLLSINAAEETIDLATPYFVPDQLTLIALKAARARGVRVRLIVPGPITDALVVRAASRASWGELLEAGVEIYEYLPTMYHTKVMVIDGHWTSVGSTNVGNRSFRLNDEANLNIYDAEFAEGQTRLLEQDLTKCRRVTLDSWDNRSPLRKLMDMLATLLSPQL